MLENIALVMSKSQTVLSQSEIHKALFEKYTPLERSGQPEALAYFISVNRQSLQ